MLKGKSFVFLAGAVVIGALALAAATFAPQSSLQLLANGDTPTRQVSEVFKISNENPVNVIAGESQQSNDKATVCDGFWQGNPRYALNNWFTGQEYYAVYQDPIETGCPVGITYPFQVQNVIWHVFNPNPTPLDVDIQPVIYTVDLTDPLCPKPGVVCCYGPLYTVTIPVGTDGATVTLPLDDGCCVEGPYFAGVWTPDFIGTGLLGIVVDSLGFPGIHGASRVCANYNNYQGLWEDLIVDYGFPGNVRLWSDGMASDMNTCDPCGRAIEPGVDLWTTPPGESYTGFSGSPIPADFFNPGSDPFFGTIILGGDPIPTSPPNSLPGTDAIILRGDRAELPGIGAQDQIPIEIVALNLVSVQPITVTYNGGQNPEQWHVRVNISSQVTQQQGQMTLTRDCCNGGTFESTLPVTPKFTFTRIPDNTVRLIDPPTGLPPIIFQTANGHWSEDIPAPFDLVTCPGMVAMDHDFFPASPEIVIPPSSKFTPGFRTVPCSPSSPNDPYCGGKVLTREQAMLSQHGVLPPQRTTPVEGACCLPDGSCIITTIECCEEIAAGNYQGDFVMCTPELCDPTVDTLVDTLCTEAMITITPSPSDNSCLDPLPPIPLFGNPAFPITIVERSPDTPYTAGETIQTEMVALDLVGSSPLGPINVRAGSSFGLPPSIGQVTVNTVDGSGNLTGGDSFFDVFIEITLPSGPPLRNQSPIRMEATIPSLPPPPGVVFTTPPSLPPVLLVEQGSGDPFGYLCMATHTIILCGPPPCCVGIRGDANGDGSVNPNILDLNFLVNYIFRLSGNPGPCLEESDANGSGGNPNVLDLNMLVNYIFRFGPLPGPCPVK